MVNIGKDISRVKRRLVLTKFFDCFLDSILIGLVISAILLLFGVGIVYSAFIGGTYLVVGFFRSAKKSSLSEIEKKIPNLEWQLRTAADNAGRKNEIIDRLNDEVSEKVGFVGFFDLVSGKRTIKRLFFALLLGGVIFYVQAIEFNLVDAAKNPEEWPISRVTGLFSDDLDTPDGRKSGFNIFGDRKDIEVGQKDLDIELGSELNEIDLSGSGELGPGSSNGVDFNGRVGSEQDSTYSERYSVDEEEIVERFYNNLNK